MEHWTEMGYANVFFKNEFTTLKQSTKSKIEKNHSLILALQNGIAYF